MKNIDGRIIWVIREPRCGSSSAVGVMSDRLHRVNYFVESHVNGALTNLHQQEGDAGKILHTHHFSALRSINNYDNPILIRLTRKNSADQFLSEMACKLMDWKFTNMLVGATGDTDNRHVFEDFTKTKVTITQTQMNAWINHRTVCNALWDSVSSKYERQVLYYEDYTNEIDIPILGLYNVNLTAQTLELPDYKRTVFINYDAVVETFSKHNL